MRSKPAPLFQEQQAFRQPRVWFLLAILPTGFLLLLVWQVLLGHSVGERPLTNGSVIGWTIFMWLVYLRLITVRLGVKVDAGELSIGMRGLWNVRKIPVGKIASAHVVTYKPVEDYGGYGIRSTGRDRAYIANGDRGVRLTLVSGGKVLIGSQRPEALAKAVSQVAGRNIS
jgi:hypothetical protein